MSGTNLRDRVTGNLRAPTVSVSDPDGGKISDSSLSNSPKNNRRHSKSVSAVSGVSNLNLPEFKVGMLQMDDSFNRSYEPSLVSVGSVENLDINSILDSLSINNNERGQLHNLMT